MEWPQWIVGRIVVALAEAKLFLVALAQELETEKEDAASAASSGVQQEDSSEEWQTAQEL